MLVIKVSIVSAAIRHDISLEVANDVPVKLMKKEK